MSKNTFHCTYINQEGGQTVSNQEKTGNEEFAFLEKRTIHELEELLHIALRDPSADEAYLTALEAAVLRRETRHPTGRLSDTDKAWDRFRSMYLAEDTEKFALSKNEDINYDSTNTFDGTLWASVRSEIKKTADNSSHTFRIDVQPTIFD